MNISSVSDSDLLQEYIKRFTIEAGNPIRTSREAADHFRSFYANASSKELFIGCFLNSQFEILGTEVLFEGSLATSAVYPREVLKRVIELGAGAVMFSHNHPSGSLTPSSSDRAVTKKLQTALNAIDVEVLDHVIVAKGDYFSFGDHRLL
jgi:DNA repair protein RadC